MEVVFTNKIDGIDLEKLMDIYEESNWENLSMVEDDSIEKIDENILYQKVRDAYKAYLINEFLKSGKNYLAILKDEKDYLSALRIYDEGEFFLLEALETNPKYRRSGYGERLVREVISLLGKGSEIRSEVAISNKKSLALHRKLGFKLKEKRKTSLVLFLKSSRFINGI